MSPTEIIGQRVGQLQQRTGRGLTILETGSIRADSPQHEAGDGWSTLCFARRVAQFGGACTSIDLDITVADTVLTRHGLRDRVRLVCGHSVDVLAGMLDAGGPLLDVAYLDSDNDPGLILHEYLLVSRLMRSPGLIMVDDVDMDSADVVKGHQLVPWLDRHRIPYSIDKRSGAGYTTGILVIDT